MWASTSKYSNAALLGCLLLAASTGAAADAGQQPIELQLRPRVCTLADNDATCNTTVRAQWRSTKDESLCLVIVDQPHIRHCWEQHSEGLYSVEVAFSQDLVVQLRDTELDRVLASQAIAVIRKALQFRRKRRQPWSIFY
ncbi:hypothetical protein GCM10011487_22940 [Steroidobacter agaridevorans]|uniref:DUF3019 domain-containing protein n=1 Tax=Steroidobacter agaridevorans TaxID=2695856 RepID=A0A829YAC3_9GAMM|nr:DUF3019 domain-containing protein [Steroidobacter agaridevorans]GFE80294.1 hypothetical protein GCM10011487_22940 [Steroidobacter agaridevorans]GFE87347.1 hypothetical protein GCM10011488_23010 [Steroidobacter agaridevorans]